MFRDNKAIIRTYSMYCITENESQFIILKTISPTAETKQDKNAINPIVKINLTPIFVYAVIFCTAAS